MGSDEKPTGSLKLSRFLKQSFKHLNNCRGSLCGDSVRIAESPMYKNRRKEMPVQVNE